MFGVVVNYVFVIVGQMREGSKKWESENFAVSCVDRGATAAEP
jgi:hypothetical protein